MPLSRSFLGKKEETLGLSRLFGNVLAKGMIFYLSFLKITGVSQTMKVI